MKTLNTLLRAASIGLFACLSLLFVSSSIYAQTCTDGSASWDDDIGPLFAAKGCTGCHGAAGGLNLNTYAGVTAGGNKCGTNLITGGNLQGTIITTGYAGCGTAISSPAMQDRTGNAWTAAELALLQGWIDNGAPEACPIAPVTDLACSGSGLSIQEILADPNSTTENTDANCDGVADAGDDYVQICNNTAADIDISNYEIYDSPAGPDFTFPAGTIIPAGGCVVVIDSWTAPPAQPANVFTGVPALNNGGDQILLYDPVNNAYTSVVYNGTPLDVADLLADHPGAVSACDEDWGNDTDGLALTNAGPGPANLPYTCPACDLAVLEGTITCDDNTAGTDTYTVTFTFTDTDGLGTYTVTTTNGTPDMATVTDMASGTITVTGATEGTDVTINFVDGADCDVSVTATTPTCDPAPAGCEPIVITEVMYDPCSGAAGTGDCAGGAGTFWDDEANGEWVELYNYGTADLDVSGYIIGDNSGTDVYEIPAGTIIPAGGYLVVGQQAIATCMAAAGINAVVGCDPGNCPTPQGGNRFNNGGDDVEFSAPDGTVCDIITYDGADCSGSNDGYTYSLIADPATFVDGTENDLPTAYGVSLNGGDAGSFGGGSPGVTNTLGSCISNLAESVAAVCNGTDATFDITFDYQDANVTAYDIYVDGVLNTTLTGYATGDIPVNTGTITIPNSTTATSITVEIRPTGADANICFEETITVDIPACVVTNCPTTQTVDGTPASVCTLGNEITDWKGIVETPGPTGAIDAAPVAPAEVAYLYSATAGQADFATFDTTEPTGAHTGASCDNEIETTYAYVVCDLNTDGDSDPLTTPADVTLTEVGSIEITYFAPAQIPTIVRNDATCAYSYMEACTGDIFDPATIPTAAPGEDPAAFMVTVTTANGCTAMFSVDPEACPPAACDLGVVAGTAACDAETDQPDTYTATFTVTDADGAGTYTVAASAGAPDVTAISNTASTTVTVTGVTEGTDVTLTVTDDNDVNCVLTATVTSPVCEPAVVCSISNVVFTQACTGNGEDYELCVSFEYVDVGPSGQFNVYLDPAGTGTPATIVAGPFNYTDYQAAIDGGAACFTITGYTGDATDLEADLEVCIGDADAPAPGTGLPPGSTPPPSGLPNADCPAILGIFADACGTNEGDNEFVVFQNGNTAITGGDITIDAPSSDDWDTYEPAATTDANIAAAGWNCACCVGADATTAIPANAVVILTGNVLDQAYDFSSLCAAAGTVYVLGEVTTNGQGHFSNSGGRSTVLNVTNAGGTCTFPQSYTYLSSDLMGGDGAYIAFSAPDNPTQTAGNNNDPAGTNGVGSNNGCTGPEVIPTAQVECFGCTTLTETACATCPTDIVGDLSGDADVCSDNTATDLAVAITGGGTGPYTVVYNDGTMDITVTMYDPAVDVISVSPTATTTYTLVSVTDMNGCTGTAMGTATITVNDPVDAGTDGTLTICAGETVTDAQLFAALGGTPDAGGVWMPTLAGAGTYIYTVMATAPCVDATAQVVVTEQAAPNAGTDGALTICEGDVFVEADLFAQLGGTPDAGGVWTPALAGAGTYTYTVAAVAPCTVDATADVVVTAETAPNAGTAGTATACTNTADGNTVVDLTAALGGTPDMGGAWAETTTSGADISNPMAVDFDGLAAGTYTFTYTVIGVVPCTDASATVTVTVSDCAVTPACTSPNVPVLTPQN